MQIAPFRSRWLEKFELPKSRWKTGLDGRLAARPFCKPEEVKPLLLFLFDELPGVIKKTQAMTPFC